MVELGSTDLTLGTLRITSELRAAGMLITGALRPSTSDGAAIGSAAFQWSDLFLAEGAVINFDNGDVTLTQTANALAIAGGDFVPGVTDTVSLGTTALNFSDLFLDSGAVINFDSGDVTLTHSANALAIAGGDFVPTTTDTVSLGTTALNFSDLFLDSGAVINFDSGDVTLTHGANLLTLAGGNLTVPTLNVTTVVGSGAISSSSATTGIGYATGAGGTVTQGAGAKTNGVTLSTVCGTITMDGASLAADTTVAFTLTNTAIAATDVVVVVHDSVGTLGAYSFGVTPAGGSAVISVHNNTPAALAEAIVLRFAVIKAVTA